MYLEEIEAIGFKSFANKTVLKFPKPSGSSKGITAIVGPNGSGKSNVADALRWVLGESSSKTLRGKSRDDVIFSGSAKKSKMNYAEVTLRLNNEDSSLPDLDMAQIEITRRVFRNGDSEFLLNKNRVRKDDIIMMLAKAEVGQRTYTVIGQGMADSVLSASLQERKEFFEEAAGVKQYQIKRHQTLNKFQATRDNLAQTDLTIKELEPRLKSLGRQMKKLEKREEIEKELKTIQNTYYNILFIKHNSLVEKSSKEKKGLDKSVHTLEKEIKTIQENMNKMYVGDSRQEVFENLQKEYNSLVQERNNLLREEALIKAKKDAEYQKGGQSNVVWLNNKKDELQQSISEIKNQLKEINLSIEESRQKHNSKSDQQEQFAKKIETVKTDMETIKESNLSEFDEESDLREIYAMQEKLLESLMNATSFDTIENIRNDARAINARLSVYIETLSMKKTTHLKDLANLQEQLEDLIEKKNVIALEISQLDLTINTNQERKDELNENIETLESKIEKIDNEIKIAQSQNNGSSLIEEVEKQLTDIQAKIALMDRDIEEIGAKIETFNVAEQEKKEELIDLQKQNQAKQSELNKVSNQLNQLNIEIAKHSIRIEDLEKEILEEGLDIAHIKELEYNESINEEEAHIKIHSLKKQMDIIGGIDEETIAEYNEIKERYDFLTEQTTDLEQAIISMEQIIEELDQTIKKQFDKAFKEINTEFQKFFKTLFQGGKAELVKVTLEEEKKKTKEESLDNENIDTTQSIKKEKEDSSVLATVDKIAKKIKTREKESFAGIEIKANPPGKKITSINMLSGGERALTSIALISAIISNNNSPFVMLDEMDAALDESNALRFASILKDLSEHTQFIVITHTRATMSQAQLLYGVTMGTDGVSKLLSIELEDAEEMDVVRH